MKLTTIVINDLKCKIFAIIGLSYDKQIDRKSIDPSKAHVGRNFSISNRDDDPLALLILKFF